MLCAPSLPALNTFGRLLRSLGVRRRTGKIATENTEFEVSGVKKPPPRTPVLAKARAPQVMLFVGLW